MNSTPMNGDHYDRDRRAMLVGEGRLTANAASGEREPHEHEVCEVGSPTLAIIAIDASTQSVGAPMRTALRRSTRED